MSKNLYIQTLFYMSCQQEASADLRANPVRWTPIVARGWPHVWSARPPRHGPLAGPRLVGVPVEIMEHFAKIKGSTI